MGEGSGRKLVIIGNVTATTEASQLEPTGSEFEKRIQGSTIAQRVELVLRSLGDIYACHTIR